MLSDILKVAFNKLLTGQHSSLQIFGYFRKGVVVAHYGIGIIDLAFSLRPALF